MTEEYKEPRCKRCGRKLKHTISLQRGYGATCYKKRILPKLIPLFDNKVKESKREHDTD